MKEKRFLQALDHIDDVYLEEADHDLTATRKKKPHIIVFVAVLISCLLVGFAAYAIINWDPLFSRYFSSSKTEIEQMQNELQNVIAVSKCGDVTLSVRQTLGNEHVIYIVFDAILPDYVDLEKILPEENDNLSIMPADILFFKTKASYGAIKDMSFQEAESYLSDYGLRGLRIMTENASVNYATNTLTFFCSVYTDEFSMTEKDITMLISSFTAQTEAGDKLVIAGPFLISWQVENKGPIYQYTINEGELKAGVISISNFTLNITLYHANYQSTEEFMKDISVIRKDGTTANLSAGGSQTLLSSGAVSLSWQFNNILSLQDISFIQIGPYKIKLSDFQRVDN